MLSLSFPSFSPKCGSRSPWLPPTSRCGDLDRWLCFFSFWQGWPWRSCQLLSLWHWGHFFLFSRPTMLMFIRWSLRHSVSSLLVSAAPTSLLLFFSSPIGLSLCPRHPVLSSVFPFASISLAGLAGTVFSLLLYYETTMGPRTLILPSNDAADRVGQTGSATCALCNPL